MPLASRLILILAVCGALGGPVGAEEPKAAGEEQPSPQTIELEILQLVPPVDQRHLDRLAAAIAGLPEAEQRQRLQQLLDQRMEKIAAWVTPNSSDDAITQRLEAFPLEAPHTAEAQDARDELVSAIMGMTDAQRRERFLDQLKERERAAGTLIEAPPAAP